MHNLFEILYTILEKFSWIDSKERPRLLLFLCNLRIWGILKNLITKLKKKKETVREISSEFMLDFQRTDGDFIEISVWLFLVSTLCANIFKNLYRYGNLDYSKF